MEQNALSKLSAESPPDNLTDTLESSQI